MNMLYWLILSIFLTACSTVTPYHPSTAHKPPANITAFQGNLLVFSPKHRFQVSIQWQADLKQGHARLTHPASGRVVELRWQEESLSMRDNQANQPSWHAVHEEQWQNLGIVLQPWKLAKVLHHRMPQGLHSKDGKIWQGKLNHSVIRLHWQNNYHLLTMIDITRGRKAVLRINP